jgi:UDP-glucuronate 4-epimerase
MQESKIVLVTGCAGFIGSALSKSLLDIGFVVIGVDNFDPYYAQDIKERNLQTLKNYNNFEFCNIDILEEQQLSKVFENKRIDIIIHLAAKAGVRPSIDQPLLYEKVNVGGTIQMLEQAVRHGIQQFILASSSSVYGNDFGETAVESQTQLNPISPYAASKKSAEMYAHSYFVNYGLNVNVLRFFTAYGPGQRPDMAFMKFVHALNSGSSIKLYGKNMARDFTYVDDIVKGIIASLGYMNGYEIINLGSGKQTKVIDVINLLGALLNKQPNIEIVAQQPGDPDFTCANILKAQSILGYEPEISIKDGLSRFVNWYQNERITLPQEIVD